MKVVWFLQVRCMITPDGDGEPIIVQEDRVLTREVIAAILGHNSALYGTSKQVLHREAAPMFQSVNDFVQGYE